MNTNNTPADRSVIPLIARGTRWLQARFPQRPLKGLSRMASWLPDYRGVVQFEDGSRMLVDSRQPAERWLLYSGNYQPALTFALKQHTPVGGCCLDIGANLGFYTVEFAQWVGATGRVIAFEANPAMVERIRQNVALNSSASVTIVSAAVHNQPGEIEFHISSNPGKSSVNAISSTTETISVPAITIDHYLSEQHWTRLDVIKMDIEGNDCNGLLGAANTLKRFRPVVAFEYKGSTPRETANAAFSLLASLDYQIWSLTHDGTLSRFDWQTSQPTQIDILCLPSK